MKQLHFLVAENSDNVDSMFYNSDEFDDEENDLHGNNGLT